MYFPLYSSALPRNIPEDVRLGNAETGALLLWHEAFLDPYNLNMPRQKMIWPLIQVHPHRVLFSGSVWALKYTAAMGHSTPVMLA